MESGLDPKMIGLGIWCLMPLSTIFQLYRGDNDKTITGPDNLLQRH